jgi:hypothetical protein
VESFDRAWASKLLASVRSCSPVTILDKWIEALSGILSALCLTLGILAYISYMNTGSVSPWVIWTLAVSVPTAILSIVRQRSLNAEENAQMRAAGELKPWWWLERVRNILVFPCLVLGFFAFLALDGVEGFPYKPWVIWTLGVAVLAWFIVSVTKDILLPDQKNK